MESAELTKQAVAKAGKSKARKPENRRAKPAKPSKPKAAVLSLRIKPSSSREADYSSDDDTAEAAKFDVSTIPLGQLALGEKGEAEPAGPARKAAGKTAESAAGKQVDADDDEEPPKPFPFLALPTELRMRVYAYHFALVEPVLDLTPDNWRVHRRLALLRTCRRVYAEASHFFYSTRVWRIFPTFPGRFFKTRRPLLARLRRNQRATLTALELRLGPGFNKPPKCWAVTRKLGLHECIQARTLHVFVQIDPSVSWLDGFRQQGFYESFSSDLLDGILREAPAIEVVVFDGYESVRKASPIMLALLRTARAHGTRIAWGPRNGWTAAADNEANRATQAQDDRAAAERAAAMAMLEGGLVAAVA